MAGGMVGAWGYLEFFRFTSVSLAYLIKCGFSERMLVVEQAYGSPWPHWGGGQPGNFLPASSGLRRR